ncbi:hypothetical protein [Peribacillus frigoritolerans]|uniref:hypothetical protein n=1 Tax=Peribacillus frigoritolerans TaxID=450367 RepID=UPI0039A31B4E
MKRFIYHLSLILYLQGLTTRSRRRDVYYIPVLRMVSQPFFCAAFSSKWQKKDITMYGTK